VRSPTGRPSRWLRKNGGYRTPIAPYPVEGQTLQGEFFSRVGHYRSWPLWETGGNGSVSTMNVSELLTFVLVLGTAKIAFLSFFFLSPLPSGVTPLSPREPAPTAIAQVSDTSRDQAIRAAPAHRTIHVAQNPAEGNREARPPTPILRFLHRLQTTPSYPVPVPLLCPGLGPRAPPA
jgi:hypothetical protein